MLHQAKPESVEYSSTQVGTKVLVMEDNQESSGYVHLQQQTRQLSGNHIGVNRKNAHDDVRRSHLLTTFLNALVSMHQ